MRNLTEEEFLKEKWQALTEDKRNDFLTFVSLIKELKESGKKVDQLTLKKAFDYYNYFWMTPEFSIFCSSCRTKVVKVLLFIEKNYQQWK